MKPLYKTIAASAAVILLVAMGYLCIQTGKKASPLTDAVIKQVDFKIYNQRLEPALQAPAKDTFPTYYDTYPTPRPPLVAPKAGQDIRR